MKSTSEILLRQYAKTSFAERIWLLLVFCKLFLCQRRLRVPSIPSPMHQPWRLKNVGCKRGQRCCLGSMPRRGVENAANSLWDLESCSAAAPRGNDHAELFAANVSALTWDKTLETCSRNRRRWFAFLANRTESNKTEFVFWRLVLSSISYLLNWRFCSGNVGYGWQSSWLLNFHWRALQFRSKPFVNMHVCILSSRRRYQSESESIVLAAWHDAFQSRSARVTVRTDPRELSP